MASDEVIGIAKFIIGAQLRDPLAHAPAVVMIRLDLARRRQFLKPPLH
jgi:hypothetical protein